MRLIRFLNWPNYHGTLLLFISLSLLTGCASNRPEQQVLHFPDNLIQPYLTLEQVIGSDQETPKGFFGRFLGRLVGPETKFALNMPTDMVVDTLGRLLIVESEAGFISTYVKGEHGWQVSQRVSMPEIQHPTAIAAGPEYLYISDLMGGTIHVLDYHFNPISTIEHGDMMSPSGLTFNRASNQLLVADPSARRAFVFSSAGAVVAQIGQDGSILARLQSPLSITVDNRDGHIYILDGMARKVKEYSPDFQYLSSFGEYDQVPGSFAFPKGMALATDGTLFVGDAAFGNIQMFDLTGALLFYFGETGKKRGQFLMPRNLFMDQDQRLYVADPYNNRVQIFRYYAQ